MELYPCDVSCMARKHHDRLWIGRFDIKEFDIMVSGGGEVAFVGRDAETVDLRVWMLNYPGAYS